MVAEARRSGWSGRNPSIGERERRLGRARRRSPRARRCPRGSPARPRRSRAKMRMRREQRCAQLRRACRTAACCPAPRDSARRIAQSSRASPGGKTARSAMLHAAFGVDVGAVLLGVGGARQDHVGAVRAAVAVVPLIDDEGCRARCRSRRRRAGTARRAPPAPPSAARVEPALARHEAEIEPADPRRRSVQHVEAVPAVA